MTVRGNCLVTGAIALATMASGILSTRAEPHYPWHNSYKAVLDQTAAVVQGTVASVSESYNEQDGPRTLVTLSELSVLWGEVKSSNISLKLFGGPVPGRRGRVDEVHIPTFVRGKRYVVFLSNRDWRLSPVTARQSFIIERVQGKDILVTTDGYAVSGIDNATGPIRRFRVYRIPNEIDENFVPSIDVSITSKMIEGAYSATAFVADLKAWALRNSISVHGAFNEQPYRTGSWRIMQATPHQLEFAPRPGGKSATEREQKPCGDKSVPTDGDPKERSLLCAEGDGQ
jgi:hypothetical protein